MTTMYHGSVGSSPASHRGSQDTISGPSFCDFWLTKWYYDTFFSAYLHFPCHYHSTNIQYASINPSPAIHDVNLQCHSETHFTKRIATLPYVCCKSCPSYQHWFDHPNNTRRRVSPVQASNKSRPVRFRNIFAALQLEKPVVCKEYKL